MKLIKYILIILLSLGVFYLFFEKEKLEQISMRFKNKINILQEKLEIRKNNKIKVTELKKQIRILTEEIKYQKYKIGKSQLEIKDRDYKLSKKDKKINELELNIIKLKENAEKNHTEINEKNKILKNQTKQNKKLINKIEINKQQQAKKTKLELSIPYKTLNYDQVIKKDIKEDNYKEPQKLDIEENINSTKITPSIKFNEEKKIDSVNIKIQTKF